MTAVGWGAAAPRGWYDRDPLELAPALLGAVVVVPDGRAARLVEVEAYRGRDDPGSHAYRGPTPRTAVMFGPPGHLYVYFSYGVHWCANVVCGPDGQAGAVLLRAAEVVAGEDLVRRGLSTPRRPVVPGPGPERPAAAAVAARELCRGPARLCRALGVDGASDGADLVTGRRADGQPGPVVVVGCAGGGGGGGGGAVRVARGPRVGLAPGRGEDLPWRWWLEGHPAVSRWRAGGRGPRRPGPG